MQPRSQEVCEDLGVIDPTVGAVSYPVSRNYREGGFDETPFMDDQTPSAAELRPATGVPSV
jgi:hypothetical protein